MKLLKANGFMPFLSSTTDPPEKYTKTTEGNTVINSQYIRWNLIDQNLAAALCSTISAAVLPYVIHLESCSAIWSTIEKRLQATNRSKVIQLKSELHNLAMKNQTMTQYLSEVKMIVDQITAAGVTLDTEDILMYTLNGLSPAYQVFKTSIRTNLNPISLDDLYSLLMSEEVNVQREALKQMTITESGTALYSSRGRGRRGRGRTSNPGTRNVSNNTQICQICNKKGHSASTCWHRLNLNYTPQQTTVQENQKAMVASTDQSNPDWYLDSGASSHLTNSIENLNQPQPYSGSDSITIGDGRNISIANSGSGILPTPHSKLKLSQILHIPQISHNLLSVYALTKDNNISISFDGNGYIIKDLKTHKTLLTGPSSNGLYPVAITNHSALTAKQQSAFSWHDRLGHPHQQILMDIANNNKHLNIPLSTIACHDCLVSKSHKLVFHKSVTKSSRPLALLHSDVWGPAPITSREGFKYYVIFIDDFSKFVWLFPMITKSEVPSVFIKFATLIENQLQLKIQCLRTDGGKEFFNQQMSEYLSTHGILHQTSCPYTPEQNGVAERKHRHLIETTRTLLHSAKMPLIFWPEATLTASYLINRLPSRTLNNLSPFQCLYNTRPDYSLMRTFGCQCFPWLPPNQRHKLAPRSVPCVFIGYSSISKGYKCLDPSNYRIYISRHVTFDEKCFPFKNITPITNSTPSQPNVPPGLLIPIATTITTNTPQILQKPTTPTTQSTAQNISTQQSPLSIEQHPDNLKTTHPMVTRLKTGSLKPRQILNLLHANLSAKTDIVDPTTYTEAVKHAVWRKAMAEEFLALQKQGTWELTQAPPNTTILGCKWTFKTKWHSDGTIARYKARLVAQGNHQEYGVNYLDTFSPVAKFPTIRAFLTIAASKNWPIHQLDVANAFLHGDIEEDIYMKQPKGFEDKTNPEMVCHLRKALYGLKQAPRQWFKMFSAHIKKIGFENGKADSSLFILRRDNIELYMVIYVDDILLTGNSSSMIAQTISQMNQKFEMKDLGTVSNFLGIQITRVKGTYFLSQSSYAKSIIHLAGLSTCKPLANPTVVKQTQNQEADPILSDHYTYRRITGALQYLTITRPDISYAVNILCQHMHQPEAEHTQSLKKLLRYIQGTCNYGIPVTPGSLDLHAYSDADWAGDKKTRKSTTGYCTFLGNNILSWSVKKQNTVSRSSTEAEYRALAAATAEVIWIRKLLQDFNVKLKTPTELRCDNMSAIALANNPVFHSKTKHIDIDQHFIRDHIQCGNIKVIPVTTHDQLADIFTKPLATVRFQDLRNKLTIQPDSKLEGEYQQQEEQKEKYREQR
ncbi:Retrovirus-related Pol polyprotein from transposon TNT 1-94 [Dendrobium catenatum]|uniref:Retrovirus-related Pol polyprotein from transposon TNT 1-94 n=1 Tax=Dendrobium catenatum TaxID=906689 RepID=A0A2I0W1C2_9ASPA|nr:Retrovirus-related Pol polyprotein from transposon TNT 1-94 [Dendrobium catenatum]